VHSLPAPCRQAWRLPPRVSTTCSLAGSLRPPLPVRREAVTAMIFWGSLVMAWTPLVYSLVAGSWGEDVEQVEEGSRRRTLVGGSRLIPLLTIPSETATLLQVPRPSGVVLMVVTSVMAFTRRALAGRERAARRAHSLLTPLLCRVGVWCRGMVAALIHLLRRLALQSRGWAGRRELQQLGAPVMAGSIHSALTQRLGQEEEGQEEGGRGSLPWPMIRLPS
jgi:hypothetical protein